ncbi:MAG: hypothetical protein IPM39_22950 [Chloroflexi bacterium]|nr:hypothetical protein [Chloroflexota bacterium]
MNRAHFHFYQLGYRRNPFGALTAAEWAAVAVLPSPVNLLLAVSPQNWQLLGPMGSGKTTSLLGLEAHFAALGQRVAYEYLPDGQSRFVTDTAELDLFLLDEAQRLSGRERRRLLRLVEHGRIRLIISSHEDLSPLFARWRRPLASVWLATEISVAHYWAVLERRLAYFALPDRERVTLAETAVSFLYDTFGHNMRDAEYFLYEVWQRQDAPITLDAHHLAAIHHAL